MTRTHFNIVFPVFVAAVALAPKSAGALTLFQLLGFLDIIVGVFVALSIVIYVGALIVYFIRLGNNMTYRDDTFPFMEFSIAILFVISVLLAIIHFFQRNPDAMLKIVGVIVFILVLALIVYLIRTSGKKESRPNEERR